MVRPACGLGFVLGLSACTALNPAYGETEGSSGSYEASSGGTRGEAESAPTLGGSTVGAEGSGEEGPGDATDSESGVAEPGCGNGVLDPGEVCDDGVNDGSYGGCKAECEAPASFCGDGVVDEWAREACDDANADAHDGCLSSCTVPRSCLDILTWEAEAQDGLYDIAPDGHAGSPFSVHCDMLTDGGGYTFSANEVGDQELSSAEAESVCGARGMQLWLPRTENHLAAAWDYASVLGDAASYLRVFGVYPSVPLGACSNMPFNSGNLDCQWRASDDGPYWVHDSTAYNEPNGNNPVDQSAIYEWSTTGELTYLDDLINSDRTSAFFCDVGDKQGP